MKRLLISRDRHETRVALTESGRTVEYYVERAGSRSLVGNIYLGRVGNVLGGMDAAFVDIGTGRNGYLCVDEVAASGAGSPPSARITQMLKAGGRLLVQVTKDGMGGKGPRLTMKIGLPGRYVVYMPGAVGCGVSRRVEKSERERLRTLGGLLAPDKGGLIMRTAAAGMTREVIEQDVGFLRRIWAEVEGRVASATGPSLVYGEPELSIRVVRDCLDHEFEEVIVDEPGLYGRVYEYIETVAPEIVGRVVRHDGPRDLFESYGVERSAREALNRRVELPSGGYLVFDHTEAMTVVDVNTGSYTGGRRLEDTILATNLEACREIVRQLRLRDIGGMIVIDFIDMDSRANREAVLRGLEAELVHDRTKTYVVDVSPLGLVEMTRRNTTAGLRDMMTDPCPWCRGEGRVFSDESALIAVERLLKRLARRSSAPGLRVEVHPRVASMLKAGRPTRVELLQGEIGRFIIITEAGKDVPLDYLAVVPD